VTPIRIGSRGSALALVQANWVADRLRAIGTTAEIVIIRTTGDDRAPDTAWGEGAFVSAIEAALVDGRIDLAVHSAKDVPVDQDPRLAITAWTRREDPRDALVCRVRGTTLASLPLGARVGTDSPRRSAFLRAARPDLSPHTLSGNVDTRLRKLDDGQSDALILAVAGLTRLARADRIDEVLPLDIAVPAPGQGALALQVRADDTIVSRAVGALDHQPTRIAVQAERAFLAATGGGCRSPIGALGEVADGTLTLHVAAERELVLPDGSTASGDMLRLTEQARVEDALRLAESLAERVVAMRRRPRVLVTRPSSGNDKTSAALRDAGCDPIHVPTIAVHEVVDSQTQAVIQAAARSGSWIVATSPNGVKAAILAMDAGSTPANSARWAVVGGASAALLEQRGLAAFVPTRPLGAALAGELPIEAGEPVLVARGDLADPAFVSTLRERGARVEEVLVYRTFEGPETSRPLLAAALDGPLDVLAFASGSAVRGLMALTSVGARERLRTIPAVCIGPSTASVAREHGFTAVVEADDPGTAALIRSVIDALTPTLIGSPT
jgi:hydroxymethylbilane synthase